MQRPDETWFEWPTDRAPSTAVVNAVAAAADVPPLSLLPLHESVDPDALDALCRPRPASEGSRSGGLDSDGRRSDDAVSVTFAYAGYEVTVRQGDGIYLEPGTPAEVLDADVAADPGSSADPGGSGGPCSSGDAPDSADSAGSHDRAGASETDETRGVDGGSSIAWSDSDQLSDPPE